MDLTKNGCLDYIPNEIWLEIFAYLSHYDLQSIRLICKRWCNLTYTAYLLNKSKLSLCPWNLADICDSLKKNEKFAKIKYRNIDIKSVELTDSELMILENYGPNIHNLKVENTHIVANCDRSVYSNLKNLQIDAESLHSEACFNFASFNLKRLSVAFRDEISAYNALAFIKSVSQTLTELEISTSTRLELPQRLVEETFQSITNLKNFKVSPYFPFSLTKTIINSLSERSHLTQITLNEWNAADEISNNLLQTILNKWSKTLRTLTINHSRKLTNESINLFNLLQRNITKLVATFRYEVSGGGVLQGIAETATSSQTLTTINLSRLSHDHFDEDFMCLLCQRLPHLKSLNLKLCHKAITNKSLAYISKYLVHLENLYLDGSINYVNSDYMVSSISSLKCPTLRVLHMSHNRKITRTDMEGFVRNCPALEELDISNCSTIYDNSIYCITTKLKHLRILNISYCIHLSERSIDHVINYCNNLQIFIFYLQYNLTHSKYWNRVQIKLLKSKPDLKVYGLGCYGFKKPLNHLDKNISNEQNSFFRSPLLETN